MISLKNILLIEYAEKKILDTIERWKQEKPNLDDSQAKAVISRFDQVKQGLASKIDVLNLSDELKQSQNYLNIDKYSLMDMVNLLRSIPEKEDKIKKEASKKFSQETGIPETATRSYVARFFVNKENLKFAVKEGNDQFSKEEVLNFIPKQLQQNEMFLDPRNWRWERFEQMMDALYPSQAQAGDDENYATTDADKVFEGNGIEIYKGDDINKCISYSPKLQTTGRKKYGWCVSQVGNTNYDYYRFEDRSPTFYFVFNRNKPSTPEHSKFDDKWHAFVVQVNKNGQNEEYRVTSANNDSDSQAKNWNEISKIVDGETWNSIKNLKDYFKPIDLSAVERGRKFASGKNLSLDEFKELNTDEKVLYIQGKSSKSSLKEDILSILPKFKIPLEGRSTTLANVAIDSGQKFPYFVLKDYESLARRYAIFRFRHTDYSKEPIPLPYVQYLDEAAKQKYLDLYDGSLTFEYIERFFGSKATEDYVNEQVKKLDFLPQGAEKYIKNPKQKQLFQIYSKLFQSWKFSDATNNDNLLDNSFEMPEQEVTPNPINFEEWIGFTLKEKEAINSLASNINNKEQYLTLLYALPYIIKNNNEKYYLLPIDNNDSSYEDWVLINKNNKIIKKYKGEDYELGGQSLILGYPLMEENPTRIYNLADIGKIGKNRNINEGKYSFQVKIPLLKEIKVNNPIGIKTDWNQEWQIENDNLITNDFSINMKDIINSTNNIVLDSNGVRRQIDNSIKDWILDLYDEVNDLDEIKINDPNILRKLKNIYFKIFEDINHADLGDEFEQYIPEEILLRDDLNYPDMFELLDINTQNKLYDMLVKYYKENKETFEEQFLRERLMNRAGLK